MKLLRLIRNYICYCGIDGKEYKEIKKSAYVSNFEVWRVLHILMDVAFFSLFIVSLISDVVSVNKWFYLGAFVYSILVTSFFFILKKDSLIGQLLIYLSISVLFVFAAFITSNKPESPAISFIAFLLITPLFMIDKPYFMALELVIASSVYLVWMHFIKIPEVWTTDLINVIIFTIIAIIIHIIVSSFRIKEFVLIRKINIQKDLDELTGLMNKGALTREINEFIQKDNKSKGIFFVLDIDYFKKINDTYGHDVGDEILTELGSYLKKKFSNGEIVGRFGGDEFIIFIKNDDRLNYVSRIAGEMAVEVGDVIKLPNRAERLNISMGIAIYSGKEENYSEIFKKADVALYKTKENRKIRYNIYEEK